MAAAASAPAAVSYIIKVPVHNKVKRNAIPPVAARLQARDYPTRSPTAPEKVARKELIVASEKARRAAVAAAHNARVSDAVNNATLMKTEINKYVRTTTDRRLQEAEANRAQRLNARAGRAKMFVQRVDTVAEKLESRKAELAARSSRKLEAAAQIRERKLATIQFRAADAAARAKCIALNAAKESETKAERISAKVETAAQRRDRFLELVAARAAFYNERHERNVENARANLMHDARVTVVKLESRMAAAEYLRTLDLRLRQSKAALTNERAASVVERQRLHSRYVPMVTACRIRDSQIMAEERRSGAVTAVAEKAHGFVRRAVLTCAAAEIKARIQAEAMRANMDRRLAEAAERKENLLARDVAAMAGGGPSPSPLDRRRCRSALARRGGASPDVVAAAGAVYRPPSPDSPYVGRGRGVRRAMRHASRHSVSGDEMSGFSAPTSPVR